MKQYIYILFLILTTWSSHTFAQIELKVYSGPFDRHGLAAEWMFKENMGLHTGASFRFKNADDQIGTHRFSSTTYFNGMFRIYRKQRKKGREGKHMGFFYGPYFRHFSEYSKVTGWEDNPYYQDEVFVRISEHRVKNSLGLGIGGKYFLSRKCNLNWEWSFGLGASPPGWFTVKTVYNHYTYVRREDTNEFIGPLNFASAYLHLAINYRFCKRLNANNEE